MSLIDLAAFRSLATGFVFSWASTEHISFLTHKMEAIPSGTTTRPLGERRY